MQDGQPTKTSEKRLVIDECLDCKFCAKANLDNSMRGSLRINGDYLIVCADQQKIIGVWGNDDDIGNMPIPSWCELFAP